MRVGVSVVLVVLMARGPAIATDEAPVPRWTDRITLSLSNRVRGEFVDWFAPPPGLTAPGAERYDFFANRFRLGVRALFDPFEVNLQFQDTVLANLPEDASLAPPVGNLGTGALYFANTRRTPQSAPVFKLGNLTWRGQGITATIGRLEYRDGLEVTPSDATLAFLAKTRIAERLVGPFDFTHVGRSFDGARVAYDRPAWNLTALGVRPTQGGFEIDANRELDIEVAGLAWTLRKLPKGPPLAWRVFYLYYRDGRDDTVKVDNRPLAEREADRTPIAISTIGSSAITAVDLGPGVLDGLLWGVVQTGSWGKQIQGAWAWAVEGGYQLPNLPLAPWLRAGWNRSSGDDNPNDDHHRTFFQLIPTVRTYARTPFFNQMNSSDAFLMLILRPHPRVNIRTDVHWLRVTEGRDLWYSGGGATSNTFFGYAGSPANGRHGLARMADVSIAVTLLKQLVLEGYFGHGSGRGVVEQTFTGTDVNYGFLEMTFTY